MRGAFINSSNYKKVTLDIKKFMQFGMSQHKLILKCRQNSDLSVHRFENNCLLLTSKFTDKKMASCLIQNAK